MLTFLLVIISPLLFYFFKDFFHFENMIQRVVLKKLQHGYAAQLVSYLSRQLLFYFMMQVFNFVQSGIDILHFKKTKIKAGFQ